MKQFHKWLTLWGIAAAAVLTAVALTTATYAWFTANRKVQTSTVTSQSGSAQLVLEISHAGPGEKEFSDGRVVAPEAVELKARKDPLMPVSTADLKTFFYCPVTSEDRAESFKMVPEEATLSGEPLYYHDTVYLRAVGGEDLPKDTPVNLYLRNDADTPIVKNVQNGELLTATRLGLRLSGGKFVILAFEDKKTDPGNTYLDKALLSGDKVLGSENGRAVAVDSPEELLGKYLYEPGSKPLAVLKLDEICTVDIYFYLEGCDPDCVSGSEGVEMEEALLELAFFALPA